MGDAVGLESRVSETGRTASRRRWSTALSASAAVHVGATVTSVIDPQLWPWTAGSVLANHLLLTAAGLWPKSRLLGPNLTRLPAAGSAHRRIALTLDDGPEPAVTPRVLDQLATHGARATFFCIGERVLRHADLAREIVRRGHCIENHSQRHRHNFSLLGPGSMRAEIERAQDGIAAVTGSRPRFFRAPAGLRNPFLEPVLQRLNLELASWTRRGFDTVNGNADSVYRRLTGGLASGDILLLHDGHAARTGAGREVVLEVLPRLLDALAAQQLSTVTLREALQ